MVISACETGKGALVRNEGVMSFAWHFYMQAAPVPLILCGRQTTVPLEIPVVLQISRGGIFESQGTAES
jgi:hypothetical protein